MRKKIKNNIIDASELPKDVVLGASVFTVTGDDEILIENFKNIIEYKEDTLLIQCKKYQVLVKGKNLYVELYTKEEMKIRGDIYEIKFLGRKREV